MFVDPPYLYDTLQPLDRYQIRQFCIALVAKLTRAPGVGVNGFSPDESMAIDNLAFGCDRYIRGLGWYEAAFPADQAIYPPADAELPKYFLWDALGYTASFEDGATALTKSMQVTDTTSDEISMSGSDDEDLGKTKLGMLHPGGSSNSGSNTDDGSGSGLSLGHNGGSGGTGLSRDPNAPSTDTGTTDPTTPTTPTIPSNPANPKYTLVAYWPEVDNATVWYRAKFTARADLWEAAARVVEMTAVSTQGGIQAGQHAATTTTTLNNPRNIDWAVWKLLIALFNAGYGSAPQF